MRKYLSHDEASGELRLVYEDLWRGEHERTEYRVTDRRVDGDVVRRRADLDGMTVHSTDGGATNYILDGHGRSTMVWTEQVPVTPTVKTPCPKAVSARRRCDLCAPPEGRTAQREAEAG